MKKLLMLFLAGIVCLPLYACTSAPQKGPTAEELLEQQRLEEEAKKASEEAALQAATEAWEKEFSVLANNAYLCGETADKAAAMYLDLDETTGIIVDRFIPEELKADSAADVRFLVCVSYCREADGSYIMSSTNVMPTAWKRIYDVQILDLRDRYVLAKRTFTGSPPPLSYTDENQGHGDYPADETITSWIPTAIEEGLIQKSEYETIRAYHESMEPIFDRNYRCDDAATKAVAKIVEWRDEEWQETYCTTYIPEELQTSDWNEVRYVVEVKYYVDCVGSNVISGYTINIYEYRYEAIIHDLKTGQWLTTKDFMGNNSPPRAESIENWVLTSIT